MQKIDGTTIMVNRGDVLNFTLSIKKDDGTNYVFQVGDVITFGIYNKEGLNNKAILLKTIEVETSSTSVEIELSNTETKIGSIVNNPIEYWYEIDLNDEHIVLGYDDNGAKVFKLFPEGSKLE